VVHNKINLHFNEDGYLIAYEDKPVIVIYKRDKNNNIQQIEGFWGKKVLASILVNYDNNKRIKEIKGNNSESVKYIYSSDNILISVIKTQERIDYKYKNGLVTEIKHDNELVNQFFYNEKAQLVNKIGNDGNQTQFNFVQNNQGYEVTSNQMNKKGELDNTITETTQFDHKLRPVKQKLDDGTIITSDYSNNEGEKVVITNPIGEILNIHKSIDDKHIKYEYPGGNKYTEEYDNQGQLISLNKNDKEVFQQYWNADGTLAKISYDTHSVHNEYDEEGILKRTLTTPPGNEKSWNQWVSNNFNDLGQLTETSDYSGNNVKFVYDDNNEPCSIITNKDSIKIERKHGLIENIESSWGEKLKFENDKNGNIVSISKSIDGKSSRIKYKDNLIQEINMYNDANYQFMYEQGSNRDNLLKKVVAPELKINYDYDKLDRLTFVNCNDSYKINYSYDKDDRIKRIQLSS
jgi:YD repeat-containing protein